MTNITESSVYEEGIYLLETTDPNLGGAPILVDGVPTTGHANAQAQQLANRTKYLKDQHETFVSDLANSTDPANGAGMVGFTLDAAYGQARTLHAKLSDSLDYKDFQGISGTSAVSESAALQAAINKAVELGKTLRVGDIRLESAVTIPSGAVIDFYGTVYGSGRNLVVNGSNFLLHRLKTDGVGVDINYSCENGIIFEPTLQNCPEGIWYRVGFSSGPKRVHTIRPNITVPSATGSYYPIYIEGAIGCVIDTPVVKCNLDTALSGVGTRAITVLAGRDNAIIEPQIYGRPIVGINLISKISITSRLGLYRNKIVRPYIEAYAEEGISFDCRGNSVVDCSTRIKLQATGASGAVLSTTGNTVGAYELHVVFQTGKLAGKSFYIGASSETALTLGDRFSEVSSQVVAGDIFTIENPCRGNEIIEPNVTVGNGQRTGIIVYGWGKETRIVNPTTNMCDIEIRGLREILGPTKDYSVPHNCTLIEPIANGADIMLDVQLYGAVEAPYTHGTRVIGGKCRKLRRYRTIDGECVGVHADSTENIECFIPSVVVPSLRRSEGRRRYFVFEQIVLNGASTPVVEIPIKNAAFVCSVRARAVVTPNAANLSGYVGKEVKTEFVARRGNETISTLVVGSLENSVRDVPSANPAYVAISSVTPSASMSGSTAFNATDAKINISYAVSGSGTGVSAATEWRIIVEVEVVELSTNARPTTDPRY